MRRPSYYSEQLLVALLVDAGLSAASLVNVVVGLGHSQFAGAIDVTGAPRDAMSRAVDAISRAGHLDAAVLDAIEEQLPGRADELMEVRVEMELAEPPNALVHASTLAEMKQDALAAQLDTGVVFTRVRSALHAEIKRRAARIVNDQTDAVRSWFDVANRQAVEPNEAVWMVSLLESAVAHAPPARRAPLQRHLDRLRITALGADPRVGAPAVTAEDLEQIVNELGISVNGWQFYERMGEALARICLVRDGATDLGTGFLVGDDLVLTNHHVLARVLGGATADQVSFVFDFRSETDEPDEGVIAKLRTAGASAEDPRPWLIDASEPTEEERVGGNPEITQPTPADRLDFALVRIDKRLGQNHGPHGDVRGHFTLKRTGLPYTFPAGAALVIVGHPVRAAGSHTAAPQTFAVEPNSVIAKNPNGTRVRYRTNTMRGSSGSPVLSIEWELVALHHLGKKFQYNQGIPVSVIAERPRVAAVVGA